MTPFPAIDPTPFGLTAGQQLWILFCAGLELLFLWLGAIVWRYDRTDPRPPRSWRLPDD